MIICSPCLLYDDEDHIWKFYVNDNRELVYSIMYNEDKWTKEKKIDNEVIDFVVSLDIDNKICIVYSVKLGELKYCVWEVNNWLGKTIYTFENKHYEMSELTVITIHKSINIFFIAKNNINKINCSLIHLCLNKDDSIFNTIDTMLFQKDIFFHYEVQRLENDNLSLIFIKGEKDEVVLNFIEYRNNKWSNPKRLYGIIGSNVNFYTLLHLDNIIIMNLSKEGPLYLLEHVLIEPDGKMKNYKVHETSYKPTNFCLVEIKGILWAIWSEGENVFVSSFKDKWSEPFEYYTETTDEFLIYKYLSLSDKNNDIKCRYVLGTNSFEIKLVLPTYTNNDHDSDLSKINKVDNKVDKEVVLDSTVEKAKNNLQEEILILKKENRDLKKELIDLQIKYQQKLRVIEESEDNFFRLTTAKRKAEEKLSIIAEIQKTSMEKLKRMEVEKISSTVLLDELTNKSQQIANEYERLKKQKISRSNVISELKNKLQQLTNEKESLRRDLDFEKSIGIVDRIFKKRTEK
ncbi:hypothetical protein [Clostridium estertheticum]|uniref:hypothetical protein n=1 Tax=Clostridium estertheticum TaxID=238834 RepID=UPI001C7D26C3|nr:hypothetical protein [Clostridium estertheticum]MBX4266230.1 hypothetical protein [Clostridium estertheticum]WLC89931.1 hypothetical protein KTC95_07000 [Clostridium estertheticum]